MGWCMECVSGLIIYRYIKALSWTANTMGCYQEVCLYERKSMKSWDSEQTTESEHLFIDVIFTVVENILCSIQTKTPVWIILYFKCNDWNKILWIPVEWFRFPATCDTHQLILLLNMTQWWYRRRRFGMCAWATIAPPRGQKDTLISVKRPASRKKTHFLNIFCNIM